MTQPGPYTEPLANPLTGSPNDFKLPVEPTRHLLGNRPADEALIRIILACQEAGDWVALKAVGFLSATLADAQQPKPPGRRGAFRLRQAGVTHAENTLLGALAQLEKRGLICFSEGSEPGVMVIQPTQALVDFSPLQAYRRH